MFKLCPPATIYLIFSLAQILIDTMKGLYNTAFMKFVVAILITFLLNGLCQEGLGVVSWIIVFIPFILMTFVVAMLLYIFGLNAALGPATSQKDTKTEKTVTKNSPPYYNTSPAYQS
jgi:predicted membrane protein